MRKRKKEHIAKPMTAYRNEKKLLCTENDKSKYQCSAARVKDRYLSVEEILRDFELAVDYYSQNETF